ncbi:hypothetical protein [Desulfosarcina ovata]|uniref:hypothetical protein n=1 Tax=Desulfosarcina ovata TaxID=83564 RepID=UPI0012D322C3|nr:hypothetical protein [Desulfosarcina ovata]
MNDALITDYIAFKIMFLGCVIGRRSITIRLPPSGLAKNIILNTIEKNRIGKTIRILLIAKRSQLDIKWYLLSTVFAGKVKASLIPTIVNDVPFAL